mmetsp:Transcript_38325/g.74864  ORF Transcript_38325/g.74864 Transcript_38325/m.74864 type:complete len:228 (-) Transcript_38325:1746-2429(-)
MEGLDNVVYESLLKLHPRLQASIAHGSDRHTSPCLKVALHKQLLGDPHCPLHRARKRLADVADVSDLYHDLHLLHNLNVSLLLKICACRSCSQPINVLPMPRHIGCHNIGDGHLTKPQYVGILPVLEKIDALVVEKLEASAAVVVLKHRSVVVYDGKLGPYPYKKWVGDPWVFQVMAQSRHQQRHCLDITQPIESAHLCREGVGALKHVKGMMPVVIRVVEHVALHA